MSPLVHARTHTQNTAVGGYEGILELTWEFCWSQQHKPLWGVSGSVSRLLFRIRAELEARARCKCTEQFVNSQLSQLALEGHSTVVNGAQPFLIPCHSACTQHSSCLPSLRQSATGLFPVPV